MTPEVRLFPAAQARLDEIYHHTCDTAQAERYSRGFFEAFAAIARREVLWRRIPALLHRPAEDGGGGSTLKAARRRGRVGADGWYARHEHHLIYWKLLPDGALGIVTILHERMHQMDRFREDAGEA